MLLAWSVEIAPCNTAWLKFVPSILPICCVEKFCFTKRSTSNKIFFPSSDCKTFWPNFLCGSPKGFKTLCLFLACISEAPICPDNIDKPFTLLADIDIAFARFIPSSLAFFNILVYNKNPADAVAKAATRIDSGFVNIGAIVARAETPIIPIPRLLLPVMNPAIAPIPAIPATGPATDPTLCALCALTSRFCSFNCCLVNGAASVASLFLSSIIFNSCFNATSLLCSTFWIWRLNEFCWALKSSCTFDIAIPGFVEIGFPSAS